MLECANLRIVVTITNPTVAEKSYIIRFTPGTKPTGVTSSGAQTATVPAKSVRSFTVPIVPNQSGTLDVNSDDEVVIGGKFIEVKCETATTTTSTTSTTTSTVPKTTTTTSTIVPVSVSPETTIKTTTYDAPAYNGLATTGRSSWSMVAAGALLFLLGMISLVVRSARAPHSQR
jgi:hypothetical protein